MPYSECPAFRLSCGELSVSAGNSLSNGFYNLSIRARRWFDHTNTSLWIEGYNNVSSTGDKSDSVKLYFDGDHNKSYASWNSIYHPGQVKKFEVTKFDTANQIISGLFDFTVYTLTGDSLRITEGRFDLKFDVCRCTKD